MTEKEKLFAEFLPVTPVEWDARVREDLKGADYEKKLIWKTHDNIRVKPYYTADDLSGLPYMDFDPNQYPFVRGSKTTDNTWEIRQDFRVQDTDTALRKAQLALDGGVTSFGFDFTGNGGSPDFTCIKKLVEKFAGRDTTLNLIAGAASSEVSDYLVRALEEMGGSSSTVRGSLEFDPLGHLTRTGAFYKSDVEDFRDADRLLLTAENELPHFRVLAVNSHLFADSGASVIQELAFGISIAAEYLTRLTVTGHNAGDIARHIQWNLGVGSDFFLEIAKLRAARVLFSGLLSAYDHECIPNTGVFLNSITSLWNKTLYDPQVNMLRSTAEAMAAILGGCNSLLVRPFDSAYRESDDFSDRMARNIQVILREEAYLDKVVDPSGGSYYIESLTDTMVENAWQLFLKVDEQGGYIRTFTNGFITGEIQKTVARREEMVSTRKDVLVGTNQYPNPGDSVRDQINMDIVSVNNTEHPDRIAEPLLPGRAAEGFERLRLAVEMSAGRRPVVFLLPYGNLTMRLARAQFAANFFACAGYEIIENNGFQSAGEGVDAALQVRADIIVICSSDDEYLSIAPAVAELAGNSAIVVVAGAPASMEELKQKGISEFIHIRSNVLETLKHFHTRLGISV